MDIHTQTDDLKNQTDKTTNFTESVFLFLYNL